MRTAGKFIAGKLKFNDTIVTVAVCVSFLVITLSVCVSSGFRKEIRSALSDLSGDVLLSCTEPMSTEAAFIPTVNASEGVAGTRPVIYDSGIIRFDDGEIGAVMFKGVESGDPPLSATIPASLAERKGLKEGDTVTAYFLTGKLKARNLKITAVREYPVETGGKLVITLPIGDLRRVNGWEDDKVSAFEVILEDGWKDGAALESKTMELGAIAFSASSPDCPVTASSTRSRFPNLFDWLNLIDINVIAILAIMIAVAGFNMISGLLINLFRNIPTIGTLKTLGMTDRGIASVFLRTASRLVLKGMIAGNAATLLFCLVQGSTHLIRLNPDNYFLSYVPVSPDFRQLILFNAIAYAAIMLLMLIPCVFISRVDPAQTVKSR